MPALAILALQLTSLAPPLLLTRCDPLESIPCSAGSRGSVETKITPTSSGSVEAMPERRRSARTEAAGAWVLECPACGMVISQATESDQRRRELETHVTELALKLGQLESGWPTSAAAMAGIGVGLAAVGLVAGATLAGYGYVNSLIVAGFVLMGVGVVGVGLVIAALVIAAPRVAASQRERSRLTEEKMRAEAELQFLRGMAAGPRP